MKTISPTHRRHSGYAMLELTMALIISGLAAYFALQEKVKADTMDLAALQGDAMARARNAAESYVLENFGPLQNGQPVTKNGVTLTSGTTNGRTYAPTVANLIAMGYLPAGFSARSSYSNGGDPGTYRFIIERTPTGCELVSTATCDVSGLVYVDRPIVSGGSTEIDPYALTAMMNKLGANGGMSLLPTPAVLIGAGGTWTDTNPVTGDPAGVIAARFGYGSSGLSGFYRVDGSVPLTGAMNANGNDINNVNNLTATGQMNAGMFVTATQTVDFSCSVANAIASGNGTTLVCSNGKWRPLATFAALNDSCTQEGATATATTTGAETLICKNSKYIRLASLVRRVEVSRLSVTDGQLVAKPVCESGGAPAYSFQMNQVTVDVSVSPPRQALYLTTINETVTSWTVQIKLRDNTGAIASGTTYGLSETMMLECQY